MKAVTFSCLLESLRLHSDSGALCDRSNSHWQPVQGPDDGESQTTALRLRAILSIQCRKYAQANAYHRFCWQLLMNIHRIYSTYTKIPGGSSCASGQGPIPPDPPAMTSPGCVIIALHNIQVRDMPSCCVSTNTVRARAAPARASLRARPARMAAAIKVSSQHVSQYMVLFNLRQAA